MGVRRTHPILRQIRDLEPAGKAVGRGLQQGPHSGNSPGRNSDMASTVCFPFSALRGDLFPLTLGPGLLSKPATLHLSSPSFGSHAEP